MIHRTLLILIALLPGAAHADRWSSAQYSGSKELLMFSLLRDKPQRYAPTSARLAHELGLIGLPGMVDTNLHAAPALAWDDNINGGIPGDTITLGPFDFLVDEESRAKEGVVLGFDLGGGLDVALGHRTLATADASLVWRYSPDHDLNWVAGRIESCLSHSYRPWRRIEGCLSVRGVDRELSSTTTRRASIEHRMQYASMLGDQEFSIGVFAEDSSDVLQFGLITSVVLATDDVGLLGVSLTLGEHVTGRSAVTFAASTWATRELWGEATSLSLSYAREEGSNVFEIAREDEVYSTRLSRTITRQLSVFAGLSIRKSTIDIFDKGPSATVGVTVTGWRR